MPKISQNKSGEGIIVYDHSDWLSGITHQSDTEEIFLGPSLRDSVRMNPYRFLGVLSPGQLFVSVTNTANVTTPLKSHATDSSNDDIYAINDSGEVHKINSTTGNIVDDATWEHDITVHGGHSGLNGHEVILYNAKQGGTSELALFYSWRDTTDGDVGRYDIGGNTFNDDFMSTVPTGAAALDETGSVDCPMVVGDDDVLYIGDGPNLHAYDGQEGANGTFTKNVLQLPSEFTIISFAKLNNRSLAIFATAGNTGNSFLTSESRCFFWNYLDQDPYNFVDLEDNLVRGAFNWKGTIGCFTGKRRSVFGQSKNTKIKLYSNNENRFITIDTFGFDLPLSGGIVVFPEQILWNSDGQVMSYGSVYKGLDPAIHFLSKGAGALTGIILPLTTNSTLLSSGNTSSGGLQKNSGDYVAGCAVDTVWVYPDFGRKKIGKVDDVTVEFFSSSSSAGQGLTFELFINDDANSKTIFVDKQEITATSKDLIQNFSEDTSGNPFPNFQNLGLRFAYTAAGDNTDAPKIKRVIVKYHTVALPEV